ncbi:MAG TPA: hypothetical protein VMZ52_20575 [Bryobacteraceae bacterium]|nr:hypothetical protein [Bryobacteraceae bacterium]
MRKFRIWAAPLGLSAAALIFAQTAPEPRPSAFSEIEATVAKLSQITGLKPLRHVKYDTIDKQHLKQFLEDRMREEIKPEELRAEELALKKFGFVPQEFDLKKTTVDLITEQAAAFYDYRKKRLFLLDDSATPEQQTVLAHELAHALADQHFHLERYLKRGKSDDSSLARMAVMEGQATWLMYQMLAQKLGQSLLTSPAIADSMSRLSDNSAAQYPVMGNAPLYMRASLLFPYIHGFRFQQAVLQKLGTAGFGAVFRNAPTSSRQILHPEIYLAGDKEHVPDPPQLSSPSKYKTLTGGTVGEFDHAVLLEQYGSKAEAQELAPHWRGGAFELLEDQRDRHLVLVYASEWDSAANGQKMFDAYQRVMKGKWKQMRAGEARDGTLEGEGDDGLFRLTLAGTRLTSVEGVKSRSEWKPGVPVK